MTLALDESDTSRAAMSVLGSAPTGDPHVHFTGGLPSGRGRGDRAELVGRAFFQRYEFLKQEMARRHPSDDDLQFHGAAGIASWARSLNLDHVGLVVGVRETPEATVSRLRSLVAGWDSIPVNESQPTPALQIRLCVKRSRSAASFERQVRTASAVIRDHQIGAFVRYFDVVGEESEIDATDLLLRSFALLRESDSSRRSYGIDQLEICCHVGENPDLSRAQHLRHLLELVESGLLDRIAHGTILWADAPGVTSSAGRSVERIVGAINHRQVVLEMCPTSATTIYGVTRARYEILAAVNTELATDNPGMFATTVHAEVAQLSRLLGTGPVL